MEVGIGILYRPPRIWVRAISFALFFTAFPIGFWLGGRSAAATVSIAIAIMLAFGIGAIRGGGRRIVGKGEVHAENGAIKVGAVDAPKAATMHRLVDGGVTFLRARGPRGDALWDLELTAAQLDATLKALGTPDLSRQSFRLRSRLRPRWMPAAVALTIVSTIVGANLGAYWLHTHAHSAWWSWWAVTLAPLFAFAAWTVMTIAPTRVDIGSDAIVIGWLGRKRRLAFSEIRGMTRDGCRLTVFTRAGKSVRFEWVDVEALVSDSAGFAEAIDTAFRAYSVLQKERDGDGSRIRYEQKLSAGPAATAGAYRAEMIQTELLEAVVLDPSAPNAARVQAARDLARRVDGHPEQVARVRVAAMSSTDDALREELIAAIDEISPERQRG